MKTNDGEVWLWPLTPVDLIADACGRLQRNLTCAEWREAVGDLPYPRTCEKRPDPPDPAQCSGPASH